MAKGDIDLYGMIATPITYNWIIIAKKPGFTSEFTSEPHIGAHFEQLAARWPDTFACVRIKHGITACSNATEVGFLNAFAPRGKDGYEFSYIKEATETSQTKVV